MARDDGWMQDANCLGIPLRADEDDIFHVERGKRGEHLAEITTAKAICQDCPVRQVCLKYALAHNIRSGIWGGMTYRERKRYFPRKVRLKIAQLWFKNHPGAEPMRPLSDYLPRSTKSVS